MSRCKFVQAEEPSDIVDTPCSATLRRGRAVSPEALDPAEGRVVAAGGSPVDLGGPNGTCSFIRLFSGPIMQQLAPYLELAEACHLPRLCKAMYHGGTDPVHYTLGVPLPLCRTYKQLNRLGAVRDISLDARTETLPRLRHHAAHLARTIESAHVVNGPRLESTMDTLLFMCPRLTSLEIAAPTDEASRCAAIARPLTARVWPQLMHLHLDGVSRADWATVMTALCSSPAACRALRYLHLGPCAKAHEPPMRHAPAWMPTFLDALTKLHFVNLEAFTLALPPTCASGTDTKDVVVKGISAKTLPKLRALRVCHPWPRIDSDEYEHNNAAMAWGGVWVGMWGRLDAAIIEEIKVEERRCLMWPGLQRELLSRPYPRLKRLHVVVDSHRPEHDDVSTFTSAVRCRHVPALESLTLDALGEHLDFKPLGNALLARCGGLHDVAITAQFPGTATANQIMGFAARAKGTLRSLRVTAIALPEYFEPYNPPCKPPLNLRSLSHLTSLHLANSPFAPSDLEILASQFRQGHKSKSGGMRLESLTLSMVDRVGNVEFWVEQVDAGLDCFFLMLADGCLPRLYGLSLRLLMHNSHAAQVEKDVQRRLDEARMKLKKALGSKDANVRRVWECRVHQGFEDFWQGGRFKADVLAVGPLV